jgi:DNA primase
LIWSSSNRPKPGVSAELKNRALEDLEMAAKFYQKQLTANKRALNIWLKERGFTKDTLF